MDLFEKLGLPRPFSKLTPEQKRLIYRERSKLFRERNPESRKRTVAAYYNKNRDKICAESREKYLENIEESRAKGRAASLKSYHANIEKNRAKMREAYQNNREQRAAYSREFYKNNLAGTPEHRAYRRAYLNGRYRSDPEYKVAVSMRNRFAQVLKKSRKVKMHSLVIDKPSLVKHIESQFLPGMTWENHGTVWHIDHKIPCAEFDLTVPEQVEQCFGFENLRPLWAKENLKKNRAVLPEFRHLLPKQPTPVINGS